MHRTLREWQLSTTSMPQRWMLQGLRWTLQWWSSLTLQLIKQSIRELISTRVLFSHQISKTKEATSILLPTVAILKWRSTSTFLATFRIISTNRHLLTTSTDLLTSINSQHSVATKAISNLLPTSGTRPPQTCRLRRWTIFSTRTRTQPWTSTLASQIKRGSTPQETTTNHSFFLMRLELCQTSTHSLITGHRHPRRTRTDTSNSQAEITIITIWMLTQKIKDNNSNSLFQPILAISITWSKITITWLTWPHWKWWLSFIRPLLWVQLIRINRWWTTSNRFTSRVPRTKVNTSKSKEPWNQRAAKVRTIRVNLDRDCLITQTFLATLPQTTQSWRAIMGPISTILRLSVEVAQSRIRRSSSSNRHVKAKTQVLSEWLGEASCPPNNNNLSKMMLLSTELEWAKAGWCTTLCMEIMEESHSTRCNKLKTVLEELLRAQRHRCQSILRLKIRQVLARISRAPWQEANQQMPSWKQNNFNRLILRNSHQPSKLNIHLPEDQLPRPRNQQCRPSKLWEAAETTSVARNQKLAWTATSQIQLEGQVIREILKTDHRLEATTTIRKNW